ncbi:MAG TPA: type IV toxin-antitoxin system AbiEi family antitoxin domain-containing protein [Solirubrobacteraceae bacterium]
MSHLSAHSEPLSATPDRTVAGIAERQGGVVSVEQLRAAGLGDGAIKRRVVAGRLHRVHRGVYAVGHPRVVGHGRMWAAVLACGGPGVAVLSHRSAAALWDLVPWPAGRIDVLTTGRRRSAAGLRVHQSRSLSLDDITLDPQHGLPVTTVARTLIDLADVLTPYRLERVCHRAEHLRLLDARAPAHPGRRTRKRDAALATLKKAPPQITRNELEERFLALVANAGLPPPRVNEDRGPYCADFLWPELNLVVETDGARTHNTDTAFHADRRRDVDLKVAGLETVRFTWDHILNDPRWVERALRTLTASPSPRRA